LLGPAWLVLNLGVFAASVGVVYGIVFKQEMREFLPYMLAGSVIWTFLGSTLSESAGTFLVAEGYIRQFSMPCQIYMLRMLVASGIYLCVGLLVVVTAQLLLGSTSVTGWPLSLAGLGILAVVGLGNIVVMSYVGVRFRDAQHLVGNLLLLVFLLTPIVFPVEVLGARGLGPVAFLNPLYHLIEIVRHPLLHGTAAPADSYIWSGSYALVVWIAAIAIDRRMCRKVIYYL